MFSAFSRRAIRSFAPVRRNMSGGAHNVEEEVKRWYKLTIVMVGFCALTGLYNVAVHEHEHSRHDLPYQKLRTKPYPWQCSDCNLFDGDCWKRCKNGDSESEHHEEHH